MTILFTSDNHFLHENVIRYSNRPFESLEEMTESLVEKWNLMVGRSDVIYHLGDFSLSWGKKSGEEIDRILSRLNGQKFLIIGNHDRKEVVNNPRWGWAKHYHELKIDMGGVHKQRIVLFHYPLRTWNQLHRGSWMLHGHSHESLQDIGGKTMDVGVDCHAYKPIALEEISDFMATREVVSCDYHR